MVAPQAQRSTSSKEANRRRTRSMVAFNCYGTFLSG